MRLRENLLNKRLLAGELVFGCGVHEARESSSIHVMANAGAAFAFIDLEHHPQSMETTADLVAGAHAAGISPMVRISDLTYESVTRVLDTGCQSLFVPHLKHPSEVHRLLELAYYHPIGTRGMALYGDAAGVAYQRVTDTDTAIAWQNDNVLIGLNIETREAMEQIEDMLVPGIHFALIGHSDLSQSYGIPGQLTHPLITNAQERLQALCRDRGIFYGAAPGTVDAFERVVTLGAKLVFYSGILAFIRRAVTEASDELGRLAAADD